MAKSEGLLILPLRVDKTPDGRIIDSSGVGESGYHENIEYYLQISAGVDSLVVTYYGENDTVLNADEIRQAVGLAKIP